jgi:hypothetical protein
MVILPAALVKSTTPSAKQRTLISPVDADVKLTQDAEIYCPTHLLQSPSHVWRRSDFDGAVEIGSLGQFDVGVNTYDAY